MNSYASTTSAKSFFFFILIFVVTVACEEEDSESNACTQCQSDELLQEISDALVIMYVDQEQLEIELDETGTLNGRFGVCPEQTTELESLDSQHFYAFVTGGVYNSCDTVPQSFFKLDTLVDAGYCNQSVDTIFNQDFNLNGKWYFQRAKVDNQVFEVPCELEDYAVDFSDDAIGMFGCSGGLILGEETFTIDLDNSVCILAIDIRTSTDKGRTFSQAATEVLDIIGSSEEQIHYNISYNFLTLTDSEANELVLFRDE